MEIEWKSRDLSEKNYVYLLVDGACINVRLRDEKFCVLVIIDPDKHGDRGLVSISDGFRENKLSWRGILLNLKQRGLLFPPKLAIIDGGLVLQL